MKLCFVNQWLGYFIPYFLLVLFGDITEFGNANTCAAKYC